MPLWFFQVFCLVALVAGGCGPRLMEVPTIGAVPHDCSEKVSGTLVADQLWVIALRLDGSVVPTLIYWPNGYEAMDDGGRLALVNSSHQMVARVGDLVTATGGLVGSQTAHAVCEPVRSRK